MVGQMLIKLRRDFSYLLQVPPRAVGKVVVLKMVAKHEIGYVPPPNVVVGLLALNKLIVLGDDVDGSGVGADGAESGDRSEDEGGEAPEVVDQVVGGEDGNVVEDLVEPDAGVVHEDGPQGVEELDDEVEDVFVPFVLG